MKIRKMLIFILILLFLIPVVFMILLHFTQIFHSSTGIFTAILILSTCFSILSLSVTLVISARAAKPLNELLGVIRKTQNGDFSARYSIGKFDEIGEIGQAFNQLMDKIESDNRELRIREERYRIVSRQSGRILFEYSLSDNSLYCTSNLTKKFDNNPPSHANSKTLIEEDLLYSDDQNEYKKLLLSIKSGQQDSCAELRLRKGENEYLWCEIQATPILDDNGMPLKIIGTITDIDQRKRETRRLIAQAQHDCLTGLYNKTAWESIAVDFLKNAENEGQHALFVLDIDDFKLLNDGRGHLYGDEILRTVSEKLVSLFRSSDIPGRFGGDEFVVLMKNIPSCITAQEKAKELIHAIHSINTQDSPKISISIGLAVYPQDGTDFHKLFLCADKALYCAKKSGKDRYSLLNNSISPA